MVKWVRVTAVVVLCLILVAGCAILALPLLPLFDDPNSPRNVSRTAVIR